MRKLIKKNEHYTRQMPPADFIADTYQCTECGNKTNNKEGLPTSCPWCNADSEEYEEEK